MKSKSLVVILHYNTVKYTDTIYELLKPHEQNDYDLLVFDNASDESKISKYTTHRIEENCYFGGGYDLVMKYMLENPQYDSMMMMSSDIICHGRSFIKTLRQELFSYEDLMVVSPCITQPEYSQCYWEPMHCWGAKEIRLVPWVDFQCPLLKRELVEKIGSFGLLYGWGNDVMTGLVCEENNWKIGVCDFVTAIHLGNATVKEHSQDPIISQYNQLAEKEMFDYFNKKGLFNKLMRMREFAKNYRYE
jgi:GT2 family glycosyltransferase